MKILLLASAKSSLAVILKRIFQDIATELLVVDFEDFVPKAGKYIYLKAGKFPSKIEYRTREYIFSMIQKKYSEVILSQNPDLIFVYNDQMLSAATISKIPKKTKIGIYLADSPLFLTKREHIIPLIRKADVVFAPDTFWLDQCRMLGVRKTEYLIPGYNENHHRKIEPTPEQTERYGSEVFFMGSPYTDTWGYKRALFLSKFCKFDFRLHGPKSWERWFGYFPELKEKFMLKEGYMPDEELNVMINCSKIVPVDANPGIINGFHIRVLDTIASGSLPLVEYREDLELQFKDIPLPLIKNYEDIPQVVKYFLDNQDLRRATVDELRMKVLSKFTIESASEIISSSLGL